MKGRNPELGVILIILIGLAGITSGELPPPIDMYVTKNATINLMTGVRQVDPGVQFYYIVKVVNPDQSQKAVDVVVTDKLPYNVGYISAVALDENKIPFSPQPSILKTGDLLYVRFEEIPAGKMYYIKIKVTAPSQAPETLYNIVNVRYANDPDLDNNTYTNDTYVPFPGYNKLPAVESFEELLHNQSRLLFDFEDLLHTVPDTPAENYKFIASFEQLLRAQANLSLSFEDLLENQGNSGWDDNFSPASKRAQYLKSFKQIIWDEAFLLASFEMKIKEVWTTLDGYTYDAHTQDAQTEFIASFEALLKDQVKLFDSYQLLLKTGDLDSADEISAFDAFESLLRVEANLLMSFEDLLRAKYKGTKFPDWNPAPPMQSVADTPALSEVQAPPVNANA